MKALITGVNGTVAPVLVDAVRRDGAEVVAWDRAQVSTVDRDVMREFIDRTRPDWICHLAMGDEDWAGFLADHCQRNDIGFLFTSTGMVFDCAPDGPHRVGDERTAKDDYGRYKVRCEDAINAASSQAIIARFGWQIGTGRGGNNMVESLYEKMEGDGVIRPSRRWIPATSFMTDTCAALRELMERGEAGTFQLDSNSECALTFADIAEALKVKHGADWLIEPVDDYVHDQRLLETRISMPRLDERLSV
jgi:dTDP-4-dehydrorhamnose reductase